VQKQALSPDEQDRASVAGAQIESLKVSAEAARDWYAARTPLAARGYLRELEAAVHGVAEAPPRWPQYFHYELTGERVEPAPRAGLDRLC